MCVCPIHNIEQAKQQNGKCLITHRHDSNWLSDPRDIIELQTQLLCQHCTELQEIWTKQNEEEMDILEGRATRQDEEEMVIFEVRASDMVPQRADKRAAKRATTEDEEATDDEEDEEDAFIKGSALERLELVLPKNTKKSKKKNKPAVIAVIEEKEDVEDANVLTKKIKKQKKTPKDNPVKDKKDDGKKQFPWKDSSSYVDTLVYIFFCSLLYLPLLLAISSSAPCYIFICRCWEGTLNGYLSQGDESTFRLNFRASSQTSVIISFKSSLNMVSYHPTIADQLSVFFLHFPLQSSYATYVW